MPAKNYEAARQTFQLMMGVEKIDFDLASVGKIGIRLIDELTTAEQETEWNVSIYNQDGKIIAGLVNEAKKRKAHVLELKEALRQILEFLRIIANIGFDGFDYNKFEKLDNQAVIALNTGRL